MRYRGVNDHQIARRMRRCEGGRRVSASVEGASGWRGKRICDAHDEHFRHILCTDQHKIDGYSRVDAVFCAFHVALLTISIPRTRSIECPWFERVGLTEHESSQVLKETIELQQYGSLAVKKVSIPS